MKFGQRSGGLRYSGQLLPDSFDDQGAGALPPMRPISAAPTQGTLPILEPIPAKSPKPKADRVWSGVGRDVKLVLLSCPSCDARWPCTDRGSATGYIASAADSHVRRCTGWNLARNKKKAARPRRPFSAATEDRTELLIPE